MGQIREIAGERYVYRDTIESREEYHFIGGYKIAIARMSIGYGPVSTPYEVNSRALDRNQMIPNIATTRKALRNQYIEHETRWLAPWGSDWLPRDYDLDGDLDVNLSPFSPPQVFEGEGAGLNAWSIRAGHFRYNGGADAKMIGLALFIREVDVPHTKQLEKGLETSDLIGIEPGPLQKLWNWIRD